MGAKPTVVLLGLFLVASGCIAAPPEIESAAAQLETMPAPGLLAAPRAVEMPAGTSFAVVRLNATPADWVEWNDDMWLFLGYEFPDGLEAEGTGVAFFTIEDSSLEWSGAGYGSGAGAGGSGRSGEPADASFIVGISVVEASAPFRLLLGAQEESFDFELDGDAVPAEVLAAGDFASMGIYFEFGSAFSVAFGGEPWTTGMVVEDTRVHPPIGSDAAGVAGTLSIERTSALTSPGIHIANAVALSFQATRAGTWTYSSTIDDETKGDSGTYAHPLVVPFVSAAGAPTSGVTDSFVLEATAEAFPVTVFSTSTFPWDPATIGLTFEREFATYGGLPVPVVLHTAEGCMRADAPAPPSAAACRIIG